MQLFELAVPHPKICSENTEILHDINYRALWKAVMLGMFFLNQIY